MKSKNTGKVVITPHNISLTGLLPLDLVNAIDNEEPLIIDDFSYAINSPKQEVAHLLGKINFYKRFINFYKLFTIHKA